MAELDKTYDAGKIEEKWSDSWLGSGLFRSEPTGPGEPYCIVIPPPNVTNFLHMGQALNVTIQDILVRWRRMQGRNALWLPGTDHAGIATQNVVERVLAEEGKTRDDLGREAFVRRVWQWKEKYGSTIIGQLKRLGTSCDWQRERFTMDEGLSRAVTEAFVRLYDKGLVYRGNYIINWCPRCQTALADEESEHEQKSGRLYYIRYPFKAPATGYVVVATTRPETMLGDVAVAVNPGDARYAGMTGKKLVLPLLDRELDIVADDFVDAAFGSGAVKVTPAHDPNDFEIARRHNLQPVNVMNGDGTMNGNAGPYAGMDRFACRERILRDLGEKSLLEKVENHQHAVGQCYRCHTAVEPRLSEQWFVRMRPLAADAIKVVREGKVRFVPDRWSKVYLDWMENIRDWCISRQIWWGHRIPVFRCAACSNEWAQAGSPEKCPKCGAGGVRQDEDVLDTWFSSWLWPFSTFGWPERNADLAYYYPTHDLVTASEIIFFWVARMIMAGLEFMGDVPFRNVYIHGTVRDDKGRKMSKSLGNAIDPLTIIGEFSADALRFTLMITTATGQDVYISNDKFEIGRNFATKLWNAARYLQSHAGELGAAADIKCPLDGVALSADDKYILFNLHKTIASCGEGLERFRFNDVAHSLYEFMWHQYCDWYVEYSKSVLYGSDPARKKDVLAVMRHVFSNALRLLHPFMPFVTEELWHAMGFGKESESISRAPWPVGMDEERLGAMGIDSGVVSYVADKYDLIRVGRLLRADYGLLPNRKIDYIVKPGSSLAAGLLMRDMESVTTLLKAGSVIVDQAFEPAKTIPSGVGKLGTIYMPIEGLIDFDAETKRLSGELEKVMAELTRINGKLENMQFVKKAPAEVVNKQQERKKELIERKDKLGRLIATMSGQ